MDTSSTSTTELHDDTRRQRIAAFSQLVATHTDSLWLAAITLVAAWCRLHFLNAPIRYDEAFTFLTFVRNRFVDLFQYPYPNNHLLNTLLVRGATDLFGRHVEIMRLPAFLFGVLAVPLTFKLSRRLDPRAPGYLAATGVAAMPFLVLYSSLARGYSLLVALTVSLLLLAHTLPEQLSWRRCALLALLSALGMWTMPSMAFALAGVGLWVSTLLLLTQRSKLSVAAHLGLYAVLTAVLTVAFYTPTLIVSGADAVVNNRFVRPLPWQDFESRVGSHLLGTWSDFTRDVPRWASIGCGVLAAIGVAGAVRTRNWAALTLVPSLLLGAAVLFLLKHSIPYARTWIYLLPSALILADLGLGVLLQHMAARYRYATAAALLICGTFACAQVVSHDLLARYPDIGVFPEASALVQRLKPFVHRGEAVHVRSPGNFPVRFYLWQHGVPAAELKPRRPRQEFIVVRKGIDRTPDGDPKLLFEHAQLEVYVRNHRPKRK